MAPELVHQFLERASGDGVFRPSRINVKSALSHRRDLRQRVDQPGRPPGLSRTFLDDNEIKIRSLMQQSSPGEEAVKFKKRYLKLRNAGRITARKIAKENFEKFRTERAGQHEELRLKTSTRPRPEPSHFSLSEETRTSNREIIRSNKSRRILKGVQRAASRAGKGMKVLGPIQDIIQLPKIYKTFKAIEKRRKTSPEQRGT